ncbi:MAG TPA: GNAT family N-acetyltransferase, partial [Opitutaceae bacterium]|nr:GNAT family N-acetyltransferase [Opitutaceae bacterium]
MASLHYRLATPEDLAAASRLVRQVFDAQVAPLYEAEGCALFYRFIEPAVWAERDRVAPRTWLAFAGRKLVGVAHVRSGRQLSLLFVEVGRQRQGVAKGLLGQIVAALGAGPLDVHASPNAVAAYERLDFLRRGASGCSAGPTRPPPRRAAKNRAVRRPRRRWG